MPPQSGTRMLADMSDVLVRVLDRDRINRA